MGQNGPRPEDTSSADTAGKSFTSVPALYFTAWFILLCLPACPSCSPNKLFTPFICLLTYIVAVCGIFTAVFCRLNFLYA